MLLCVDNGFDTTKVRFNDQLFKFPSRFQKAPDETQTSRILEFEGENWINSGDDNIDNNKTDNLVHKLCTIKALAEVTDSKGEFDLMLDLPLIHYRNKDYRQQFEEYMRIPKVNHIRYKGISKKITINSCQVMPQALSALYADDPGKYRGKIVGIIDIGGLTIDGCIVEDLHPISKSMFTLNLGTKILETKIKTEIYKKMLIDVQDFQMPQILENGIPNRVEESRKIIYDVLEEHLIGLKREMRANNWSIETLDLIGIGGGSLKFKEILKKLLPNLKLSNDPEYDNVKGLYNIWRSQQSEN